jgi:hypothetical protein
MLEDEWDRQLREQDERGYELIRQLLQEGQASDATAYALQVSLSADVPHILYELWRAGAMDLSRGVRCSPSSVTTVNRK